MFWLNKQNPAAVFQDIRQASLGHISLRPSHSIEPDIIGDYRNMPHFKDNSFPHIVWDPPHLLQAGLNGWQAKKYGILNSDTWREDLRQGFIEIWRVLKPEGTLIFKWNEQQIKRQEVLALFPVQPAYGHPTARNGLTMWFAFIKPPERFT